MGKLEERQPALRQCTKWRRDDDFLLLDSGLYVRHNFFGCFFFAFVICISFIDWFWVMLSGIIFGWTYDLILKILLVILLSFDNIFC